MTSLSVHLRDWAAQGFDLLFTCAAAFSACYTPARSSFGWGVASVAPQPAFSNNTVGGCHENHD